MSLTLDDAIEIHGRALKHRNGVQRGAAIAEEEADRRRKVGDDEGFDVWMRVSSVVLRLAVEEQPGEDFDA